MALVSRQVTCSDTVAKRIVGADNMPHRAVLHNATKSSNEYIYIAGGSAASFSTVAGMHIDPGQTIYVDLAPNDELWATSDPDELVVQVLDMRRND
jgi:hypothetical protein